MKKRIVFIAIIFFTIFTSTTNSIAAPGKRAEPESVVIFANSSGFKGVCIPNIRSVAEDGTSTPFILPAGYRLVVTDLQATLNGTAIDGTTRGAIKIDGNPSSHVVFGVNFAQQGMVQIHLPRGVALSGGDVCILNAIDSVNAVFIMVYGYIEPI